MSIQEHSTAAGAGIHVNHYCCVDGCDKWGGFGFSRNKTDQQYWCWPHYPYKPGQVQGEAAAVAETLGR